MQHQIKYILFALFISLTQFSFAQDCNYAGLSTEYIFRVKATTPSKGYDKDIHVDILRKSDKSLVQKVVVKDASIFDHCFKDCNAVKSFSTDLNKNKDFYRRGVTTPAYSGDFIVADFDFDGREDFAVISSQGSCCTNYKFFRQNEHKLFVEDEYLDQELTSLPDIDIVKKNISLTDDYIQNKVHHINKTMYTYDGEKKKWLKKGMKIK